LRSIQCVTQSMLVEGKTRVRICVRDGSPPPGFTPARTTLEDFYLVLMRTGGQDRPAQGSARPAAAVAGVTR
jgi:hypothetical protein